MCRIVFLFSICLCLAALTARAAHTQVQLVLSANPARPGDTVLNATSDYFLLSTYAARKADGALALLVINKDNTNILNAQIGVTNFFPWTDGWPSRPRVMRLVDFLQALLDHMRVNLRRCNLSVPQHELDGAQIGPPLQKMRGKAVTKFMRSQPSAQTQLDAVIMQYLPDRDAA